MTTLDPGGSAPFTIATLGEALERRMVAAFSDFRAVDDNPDAEPGSLDTVSVHYGSVKSKTRDANGVEVSPSFPLVLIRFRTIVDEAGDNGAKNTIVTYEIVFGARRIGNEGCQDIVAMLDRIRTNLLKKPTIENRARLELPFEGEVGEDDAFPQWYGVATARFNIGQPIEESEEIDE